MGIIRVAKNSNYVVMNRTALNDDRLSWKAKGIMAYMLSMPDDWVFYMDELISHAKDGKDSFRSGFKELKDAGYVDRKPIKDEQTKKIVEWETIVHEVPFKNDEPHTDFPHMEKPQVGNPEVEKPQVENPPLLSTDNNQVLNKPNTDNNQVLTNNKEESVSQSVDFGNLATFYEKNIGPLLPVISQELGLLYDAYKDVELIQEAFKISIQVNAKNKMRYTEGILKNWKAELITTYEQLQTKEEREQNGKSNKNNSNRRMGTNDAKNESSIPDDIRDKLRNFSSR